MPRPTKLNAQTQQKIVDALSAGNYFDAACAYAGIDESTGYNWTARAREELERRKGSGVKSNTKQWNKEQLYVEFLEAVTQASAQVEVGTIAQIKQSGVGITAQYDEDGNVIRHEQVGDWRALSWFMEHRYPSKWGKQVKEVTGKDGSALEVSFVFPDAKD